MTGRTQRRLFKRESHIDATFRLRREMIKLGTTQVTISCPENNGNQLEVYLAKSASEQHVHARCIGCKWSVSQ
jgi:hypothetical protein